MLGHLSWQQFVTEYWQKASCYVERNDPEYFKNLVSREEVDFLINTHGGKSDFVISLIGGKIDAPNKGVGHKPRSYWTPAHAYDAFSKGSTIRIGNIASHVAAIRSLQQYIEGNLEADVNINLYLTPPASRAFAAHYDDHDVFIIQVSGSKTWKLSLPAEPSPVEVLYRGRASWLTRELPDKTRLKPMPTTEKEWTVKLKAGDLLYVPRGHMHQVYSEDEESLHLTVAVTVVTWYEVIVQSLMETLKGSDILREALPPDMSGRDFGDTYFTGRIEQVRADLNQLLTKDVIAGALEDMTRQFIISRKMFYPGESVMAAEKEKIGLSSELRVRPDIICRKTETTREIILYYSGNYVAIPFSASSMLNHILDARKFVVKDLPTHVNDLGKVNLCRYLFEQGFLELVKEN